MRRRLGIVQAFLGSPELVLLDEPLNGLDPKETVNARSYFQECRGRQTLVISSHLLSELEAVCDAVAFVEQGKTLRQGGLQEILREDRLLTYALDSFPLPLPALASAAPMVQMETVEERKELTVRFASSETSAQAVNASLVPILLAQGIGILEIRRGSSLEREYLQSHPMSDRNARNTDAREAPVG
jgi:ABC-2 type transport system ATP-binding protein